MSLWLICNNSLLHCHCLCFQSPSLDFSIRVTFNQYTLNQLILILIPVQRRIYPLNFIHGFRAAHAIAITVLPNQNTTHKINISTIKQCNVIPNTVPNKFILRLVITEVCIQFRMWHTNNDSIFFKIYDWIPTLQSSTSPSSTLSSLHLVKIFRTPFHLFLPLLLILLGAIDRTYIGFACCLCIWRLWLWSWFRRRFTSLLHNSPLPCCSLWPYCYYIWYLPAKYACNRINAYCHLCVFILLYRLLWLFAYPTGLQPLHCCTCSCCFTVPSTMKNPCKRKASLHNEGTKSFRAK